MTTPSSVTFYLGLILTLIGIVFPLNEGAGITAEVGISGTAEVSIGKKAETKLKLVNAKVGGKNVHLVVRKRGGGGGRPRGGFRHRFMQRNRHRHQDYIRRSEFHEIWDFDPEGYKEAFKELRDDATLMEILEIATEPNGASPNISFSHMDEFKDNQLCKRKDLYQARIQDSLRRILNFFGAHIDDLEKTLVNDHALALATLQAIDVKHGGYLNARYPMSNWIARICDAIGDTDGFCYAWSRIYSNNLKRTIQWKSHDILENALKEYNDYTGQEKETCWSEINSQCLAALILRCEVPLACDLVMFDPVPRSQYQLTHQLLFRVMAGMMDCLPEKEKYTDPNVNLRLCAKMYREAQLLATIDDFVKITHFQDLFVEEIDLCGYLGFPNFFRSDWLEKILSWQSPSEFGCFLATPDPGFVSNDPVIKRKLTEAEKNKCDSETLTEEFCQPHFTSIALMTLSMFWEYMEDNCF